MGSIGESSIGSKAGEILTGQGLEGLDTTAGVGGGNAAGEALKPILGGENVTVTEVGTFEKMVRDSQFETAKNTIDNMVDSPEERKEKAARKAEDVQDEEMRKEREAEQLEKTVQAEKQLETLRQARIESGETQPINRV